MAKTAIVTGASRGIGKQIALRLAKDDYKVVVNFRSAEQQAMEVLQEMERMGKDAILYQADVGDFDAAKQMMDDIKEQFGSIDLLVNNAGITRDGLLARMKEEDFDEVIRTNLKSVFNCCRHAAPYMMKQRAGKIINMTSVVGLAGQAGQTNYAASKAGIVGFTKALAQELGSRGITVNAVAPGYVQTEMTDALSDKVKEAIMGSIPLGRGARAEEIANTVAYLASEQADYITGQVISVNGGMY
ncbi:MAG: 3-oxoacyl-[acyl-carrier-protein] reductase [Christensenellaceae bacterium]|jgi:3-oxoacyl-[acyl-carrier protein] reductase